MNLVIFTAILSYLFYRLSRRRAGAVLTILALVFFLLFSTNYLPGYLVARIESQYIPFDADRYSVKNSSIYIHVLGGGYTLDKRLPPHEQLSMVGLGRLSEAIRIFHLYDSSVLVVSGNVASGDESLASVARKAAISLGVESDRIRMLSDPATTLEEAREFARRFGPESTVIVVTDAVHMPRAMRFFRNQGLNPYPAPANYLINEDDNPFALRWMPSAENFLLMDRAMREFFGSVKGKMVHSRWSIVDSEAHQ
jgi:uncharacterized SAM-binding protein YcdF (DUF218 family)